CVYFIDIYDDHLYISSFPTRRSSDLTLLFGQTLCIQTLIFFWLFSIILALVYLSISIFIGSIAKNRWQALIGGITVWFLTIIARSEEHTSELQSRFDLVCRLLLEKKN